MAFLNVSQHILHIAGPMIVAQFINVLYNVVDRIYIGRLPDVATLAMSGLGLCLPLISIIIAFANLFGMGGSPLCSIARGSGDNDLAEDNINFSPNDDVGGAYMVTGTTWTMGGMIAETAGVPIKNVFGANDERSYENGFVHGAVSLGDILKDEGYRQYIMVGSDLEFGGRLA